MISSDKPCAVVATGVPASVLERLREGARVVDVTSLAREAWGEALAGATGLLVNSAVPINDELLAAAPLLRIVATVSVGYDNVDTNALAAREIALTNSRGSLVEAVADLTFALVIAAQRRLGCAIKWAHSGRWREADAPFGHDLAGATLGIVGMGEIGLALARRARTSGMSVIYHNRRPRDNDALTGAGYRSFTDLLGEADCIAILVPLSAETRGMFDDAAFAQMKPGAVLVNAARGPVVDTPALLRALESGRLAGAALDVTDPEPLPAEHPFYSRDDVLVLPHVGSATFETRTRMAALAAENLLAAFAGRPLLTPVTLG